MPIANLELNPKNLSKRLKILHVYLIKQVYTSK